ncbi:MAG: OmpA family protein [Chitinophagaceae bacterium]|nr:OmpA family protein [Chitinophagaceae bacterium]
MNLIEVAKSLFTNELVSKASTSLGESESGITKALSALVPSVLSSVINKSSTSDGANTVAQMANEQYNSGILDNIGSLLSGGGSGVSGLLSGLFGNKTDLLGNLISKFSGVKSSTSSSLFSLVAPALLSLIGKHAAGNNLNASSLASYLGEQKNAVESAFPGGFSLSSILGGDASHAAAEVGSAAQAFHNEPVENKSGMGWLLPILLLAAIGAASLYISSKGCKKTPVATETHTDSTMHKDTASTIAPIVNAPVGTLDSLGNFIYNIGSMVNFDLPGGVKLTVGENSTEAKLIRFLQSSDAVDTAKGNWFDFTNVRFKTNSSDITEESILQLKNFVTIAKSFPNAKFKIGGYTDNTGDEAKNVTLSKNRAAAVLARVKAMGAPVSSLTGSDGYGAQFPVGDNATAEGKAQNRRVSVNVKAK